MASFGFRRILEGLRLIPKSSLTLDQAGDLQTKTSDGRLYYHDGTSSSAMVTESSTDTLTNKTLVDPIIEGGSISPSSITILDNALQIENHTDNTKVLEFDASPVTTGTTAILSSPPASDTIAGIASTQTLTNKTISGASNTINNIVRANIDAGSANQVIINDGSGLLSSEATLAKSRGGTGADNSSVTFPSTGVIVTEAGTETLTNKTLTAPVVDKLVMTQQGSTPSTPASGFSDIYVKTNGTPYILGPNGIETPIGSGAASGNKNYLSNYTASTSGGVANIGNGNFELGSTAGFSLFHTTLTGVIPTGSITAGAASITTFSTVNSGQLAGNYSLDTASSGVWAAGAGFISNAFYIDLEDQAKTLNFNFSYSVISGLANLNFSGTSSNTFAVYIYDVTNSAWIQPQGVYNLIQGFGVGQCVGSFQTTSNSTQYQIAVLDINATAGAVEMYWDDFTVGPGIPASSALPLAYFQGHMDLVSLSTTSQTFNDGTSAGTNTLVTRQSNNISVTAASNTDIAGLTWTPNSTSAVYLVTASIFCRLVGTANASGTIQLTDGTNVLGFAQLQSVDAGNWNTISSIYIPATGSPLTLKLQFRCASGDTIQTLEGDVGSNIEWTIVQLNPSVGNSSGSSGPVVAMIAKGQPPTGTISGSFSNTVFGTKITDTNSAYNASTGTWTCPISGFYNIAATVSFAASTTNGDVFMHITKNAGGTPVTLAENLIPVLTAYPGAATEFTESILVNGVQLIAGDTINIQADSSISVAYSNTVGSYFSIVSAGSGSSSGSSSSSPVIAQYNSLLGPTLTNSLTILNFDSKQIDTNNAVTTGASWKFTAPVTGYYQVSISMSTSSTTLSAGATGQTQLWKNGIEYNVIGQQQVASGVSGGFNYRWVGQTIVQLNSGDYIQIYAAATPNAVVSNGGDVYVNINLLK